MASSTHDILGADTLGGASEMYARLRAATSRLSDENADQLVGDLDKLLEGEMALLKEVKPKSVHAEPVRRCQHPRQRGGAAARTLASCMLVRACLERNGPSL